MDLNIKKIKFAPGVRTNLILFFISQFATILATRIYLLIAGFPQILFGEFHLAHVLWGGVLMYLAFLLAAFEYQRKKVIYILAGIGYGLFIDEVGKFITVNNDYHHYLSLPIIGINLVITLILLIVVLVLDRKKVKKV